MSPASIVNYLSALWHRQKALGYESHASDFIVHQTVRGLRRCFSGSPSTRHPLSKGELQSIYYQLNTLLPLDLVFWAAVTLAFRALLRKCHYTISGHSLVWSDVSLYPDHLVLIIRSSKTDQFSLRPHRIVLNASPGSDLCPVFWLYALARAHRPLESDYVFRGPSPQGLSRISYQWFNHKLKALSSTIGLDSRHVSSHSLRHGGASLMSALGCDISDIRARGSWASSAIFRYLQHSDETLRTKDLLVSMYI